MVPGDTPGIKVVDVYDKLGSRAIVTPRVHFENVRVPRENIIGKPGDGVQAVSVAFSWTAALIGAAAVGIMRAAFDEALEFALTDRRGGSEPVIVHQGPAYLLADIKMRIEACRYLSWKACQYFEDTGGLAEELAIMAKVYCSELAVQSVYDAMRVKGVNTYVKRFSSMERLMRNAMAMPLYDGGNMGVRRRQLQQIFRQPGYNSMLAARSEMPPWLKH
jgi:alkylation response protein AidB-like acyl-CoA dehydrogenase